MLIQKLLWTRILVIRFDYVCLVTYLSSSIFWRKVILMLGLCYNSYIQAPWLAFSLTIMLTLYKNG